MLRMRSAFRFIASMLFFVAVSLGGYAGEIRYEVFPSPALGRDLKALVYLPDGYDANADRYSVLYLLHGAGGDETVWQDKGRIKEKADALMAAGTIPRAIIVMPGCPSCWWIDGTKDKAETAFWNDLVPGIGGRYRTIESRSGRLVVGLSAGGYGAVRFAMRYPDKIAAVAALSPAVYAEAPPQASAARTSSPFLGPDGQFSQTLWTSYNYPKLIDGYFAQSYRVPFYLVSGDSDTFGIAFETALLFRRLFEKQPERAELRIVDGDHSWKVWETVVTEALSYVFRFADKPQAATRTANVTLGEVASKRPDGS